MLDDAVWVRNAAARIKQARGDDLDDDWLNDGVKGFLSPLDASDRARSLFRSYPSEDEVGLRVFIATPEYLLAMKYMAMRLGGIDGRHDNGDIMSLIKLLELQNADQVLNVVATYYPQSQIPPKTVDADRKGPPWQP